MTRIDPSATSSYREDRPLRSADDEHRVVATVDEVQQAKVVWFVYPGPTSPVEWLPRRLSAVLGCQGGGEKVGEQLSDALVLVVMDPMRGVGQALDPVEVGYVIVVGLG